MTEDQWATAGQRTSRQQQMSGTGGQAMSDEQLACECSRWTTLRSVIQNKPDKKVGTKSMLDIWEKMYLEFQVVCQTSDFFFTNNLANHLESGIPYLELLSNPIPVSYTPNTPYTYPFYLLSFSTSHSSLNLKQRTNFPSTQTFSISSNCTPSGPSPFSSFQVTFLSTFNFISDFLSYIY